MRTCLRGFAAISALLLTVGSAAAQDKIRIGLIYTLSGPPAALGQQSKNGFELALKHLGGKMGGKDVELVVVDDELKPDLAIQKARAMIDRDKVDVVVGPIFSNVLVAIHKPVLEAGKVLISTNAGASSFAGAACNAHFFVTSYQNDQIYETLGKVATDKGYKTVYAVVPNYQAGKDALAGFKRTYQGKIVEESLVPLNNLDFQAEITKINASKPDALFTFMPGGLGISLIKQLNQAGLKGKLPILSAFTADEATLPVLQDAAEGVFGALTWAPNLDNPENKKFVADYEAAYNAVPASYAMQAYDAAMLIDSAVRATGGNVSNTAAFAAALKKADFKSVRGPFKFNVNGYPIEDFYLTKVVKRPDGKFQTEIVEKVLTANADSYAKDCKL
ncbi:ABC transporter substrate-binding protein [Pseudolabrys taiwanensis]|uniref:ABC transporter substrate-binding protein n=1 Tax=Pseudolabrys taiwanensis TaxID=331696 RepID=A0A346A339_9HYPH|nr:ABC transporter substrate-binding protein [Pseudolabrys taiwanensis]AXK83586.1 ABC transporter substrate-binding protein [Pseudolabrys taiwanensis]